MGGARSSQAPAAGLSPSSPPDSGCRPIHDKLSHTVWSPLPVPPATESSEAPTEAHRLAGGGGGGDNGSAGTQLPGAQPAGVLTSRLHTQGSLSHHQPRTPSLLLQPSLNLGPSEKQKTHRESARLRSPRLSLQLRLESSGKPVHSWKLAILEGSWGG